MLVRQFNQQAVPIDSPDSIPDRQHRYGDGLQDYLLQGVSRTFALTIPQLPTPLCRAVSNAYLLCRIVDTIEDEPSLSIDQKAYFCEQFIAVVTDSVPANQFTVELQPLLSGNTKPAEHQLIQRTAEVIDILFSFDAQQQEALTICIATMSRGMAEFQQKADNAGLNNIVDLNQYCYYVAGVVGEMLTRLFCYYSPEIEKQSDTLMQLAVSFGQGLQMTNILKDIWDDFDHGACWLPQDVFTRAGFDLHDLAAGHQRKKFGEGLEQLISISSEHLADALAYTLLIPKQETGIRNFCLWAIGMAVLTLRKIHHHLDFSSGKEVKISRRSVKATIITSRLTAAHDSMLRTLFNLGQIGMPRLASGGSTYSDSMQSQKIQRHRSHLH